MREELTGKYSLSVKVGNHRHFEMRLIAYNGENILSSE
jgi:uncharacterized protein YegP (UPF0339 family)